MTKIAFVGAGSLGFTGELVRDILTFRLVYNETFSLFEIHRGGLVWANNGV
jgi:alpha-galactosidase